MLRRRFSLTVVRFVHSFGQVIVQLAEDVDHKVVAKSLAFEKVRLTSEIWMLLNCLVLHSAGYSPEDSRTTRTVRLSMLIIYESISHWKKTTLTEYHRIKEPMQQVADAVIKLSTVFFDISKHLALILADMGIWQRSPSIFIVLGPKLVELWQQISALCYRYIYLISGGDAP